MSTEAVVLIIIAGVAIAAVLFSPTGYMGQWRNLANSFETSRRPLQASFRNVAVQFGHGFSAIMTPWKRHMAEYARFDVEIDDDGLWLMYDGPEPKKAPPTMLIPFSRIHHKSQRRKWHYFEVFADQVVPMSLDHELGGALKRRLGGGEQQEKVDGP